MKKQILIVATMFCVFAGCDEKVPPLDTSCKQDSDCELTSTDITGDPCCSACAPYAVSTTWLQKADAICSAQMQGQDYFDRCPNLSCPEPPESVAQCLNGTCNAKTTHAK